METAPTRYAPETVPAHCARCGAPVVWVRRTDSGRFHRPLDAATSTKAYVIESDGQLRYTDAYLVHDCGATPVEPTAAPIPVMAAAAPETGVSKKTPPGPSRRSTARIDQPKYRSKAQREAEIRAKRAEDQRLKELAQTIDCTVCPATVGEPCIDLGQYLFNGERLPERFAHRRRRIDSGAETLGNQSYPDMLAQEERWAHVVAASARARRQQAETARALYDAVVQGNECRDCGASRTIECWDLAARRRGVRKHAVTPHAGRRQAHSDKLLRKAGANLEPVPAGRSARCHRCRRTVDEGGLVAHVYQQDICEVCVQKWRARKN